MIPFSRKIINGFMFIHNFCRLHAFNYWGKTLSALQIKPITIYYFANKKGLNH